MGQAKRRKQQLGDLYGTPKGSRPAATPTDPPLDPWAEVERLTLLAQKLTFAIGDVWRSPGQYHFEVVHVSADGVATMQKLGSGWQRTVKIRWNSPKMHRWELLTPAHRCPARHTDTQAQL